MESFKDRRKNYFIKKEFQRNFIMKFCILVIIGVVISGAIIYIMAQSTVTTTFENSRLTIKSTADYILPAVFLSSAIVILSIGLATIVITLFASHKIAGPLYRIEEDIKEVAEGNLTKKFNLRESDELKALAESLDDMAGGLKEKIEKIKHSVNELEPTLKSEEAKAKIKELKEILNKIIT